MSSSRDFESIFTVLVNDDLDTTVLTRGVSLANSYRARLTVAWLTEQPTLDSPPSTARQKHETLNQRIAELGYDGMQPRTVALGGKTIPAILREVNRGPYDLVVISAQYKPRLGSQLMGHTIPGLMFRCRCPVFAVRPKRQPARIIAAVRPAEDASQQDGNQTRINDEILKVAISLLEAPRDELHVVHAWHAHRSFREYRDQATLRKFHAYKRELRATHQAHLETLAAKYQRKGRKHRNHLVKGDTAHAVSRVAEEQRGDVVVVGVSNRTGITELLIGHTVETVFHQVSCSVLSIKHKESQREGHRD